MFWWFDSEISGISLEDDSAGLAERCASYDISSDGDRQGEDFGKLSRVAPVEPGFKPFSGGLAGTAALQAMVPMKALIKIPK